MNRKSFLAGPAGFPPWIFLTALALRLALWAFGRSDFSRYLEPDSYGYLALADHLRRFHVFSLTSPAFQPETFRTPGYPLFLYLCSFSPSTISTAALVQCFLGAAMVLMAWPWLYFIGGKRGATWGSLILAADPVLVMHTPLILTEATSVFILVPAAAAFWRSLGMENKKGLGLAAISGLCFDLATLIRPVTLYLPAVLSGLYWRKKRKLSVFLLSAYFGVFAWSARNKIETGSWAYSSAGGWNLLMYPAASIESMRTGGSWREWATRLQSRAARIDPGTATDETRKDAADWRTAWPIIESHPLYLGRFVATGVLRILGGTGWEMLLAWTGSRAPPPESSAFRSKMTGRGTLGLLRTHPWLIPLQVLYMSALALIYWMAIAGLLKLRGENPKARFFFLLISISYLLLISTAAGGVYRYRIALLPFLAACVAAKAGSARTETPEAETRPSA